MATYPNGVYAPRTKENRSGVVYDATKKTVIFAEDIQNDDAEIVAVETELGTNPNGAYASVAAFLSDLLSKVISVFTDIPDVPSSYSGQAGNVVKVKATEDGLEFGAAGGGGSVPLPSFFYNACYQNSTRYAGFNGYYIEATTEVFGITTLMPVAGTIKNLYVKLAIAPAANCVITVRKNGVDTALTCTINGATTGSDTIHSFTVVAGDYLTIKSVTEGNAGYGHGVISVEFVT